jgi:hypothetical protein
VNLNNVFVLHNSFVCRQYELEFEQLKRGMFGRGLHGDARPSQGRCRTTGVGPKRMYATRRRS